ncbi:MAG TPA: mechanosensitive ion channel domain-containing protein [Gaiellaceae bacterium]|jgi:small conductance mechanosensitive channel|nr:mechanosensitive ion channel domain-containing protein [Gaiellaceae bacterium]
MVGALTIVFLFAAAWLLARCAAFVALKVLVWNDRRSADHDLTKAGKMARLKRRETQVSIIRAGITYLGFGTAAVLSVGQLIGGVDRLTAIAGASFVLILVGFAVQRVLMDIIAGLAMFIERWYSVGDTIQIPMHELQGIVEDLSLRHTRLRTLDGEVIHIHNSQIPSVRVLPGGAKDLRLEVFVTDQEKGIEMVDSVASILPEGPTTFVRKPRIEQVDELSDKLFRISVRASVAPGREWLVDGFFADLIRERAEDGVIAHGPVTLSVDESAARSYARASALTRRTAELTPVLRRVS